MGPAATLRAFLRTGDVRPLTDGGPALMLDVSDGRATSAADRAAKMMSAQQR